MVEDEEEHSILRYPQDQDDLIVSIQKWQVNHDDYFPHIVKACVTVHKIYLEELTCPTEVYFHL